MDKVALGKSVIICGLSWAAIPFLYYMFRKREGENEKRIQTTKVAEKDNK